FVGTRKRAAAVQQLHGRSRKMPTFRQRPYLVAGEGDALTPHRRVGQARARPNRRPLHREDRCRTLPDGFAARVAFRTTQSLKVASCASFCEVHICSERPSLSFWV